MAASATLHCLTGCVLGEIVGLMIGTGLGFSRAGTIGLAVGLAFLFGYTLSSFPLLKAGLSLTAAVKLVFLADTISILTMEIVDNAVMALVPNAMTAGLANPIFWLSMALAFAVAYGFAFPVNLALLRRNQGHALVHEYHHGTFTPLGWRKFVPALAPATLAAFLAGGLIVGLVVSVAADQEEVSVSSHS